MCWTLVNIYNQILKSNFFFKLFIGYKENNTRNLNLVYRVIKSIIGIKMDFFSMKNSQFQISLNKIKHL